VVDVRDAKRWINGRLIWISRRPGEIVQIEARKKLVFA